MKRFTLAPPAFTRLKPGANEIVHCGQKLICALRCDQRASSIVKLVKTDRLAPNLKQELIMAKGNNSQKKETKKPKKEKPKAAPAASRRAP